MSFQGNEIVFENFLTHNRFGSNVLTCKVLSLFDSWKTPPQVLNRLPGYTRESIVRAIENLVGSGLLVAENSEEALHERKFGPKWLWPAASRYYHFSTRLGEFRVTLEQSRKYYERALKGKPQPPIYKSYPGRPRLKLLSRFRDERAPFFQVLRRRKSVRAFSENRISFEQLSKILYYTWGRMSYYKIRGFGRLLHKTSPSAGARHPIEAYVIVNNVESTKQGIYHYSVKDHSLELMKVGDFKEKCVKYCAGQYWAGITSALFIMTAVVARTAWKYRIARVYRAFLLDAGHLSQTFFLVAAALGLGAFCTGIVCDTLIEEELGLDGISEIVLFVVGVGEPDKRKLSKVTAANLGIAS